MRRRELKMRRHSQYIEPRPPDSRKLALLRYWNTCWILLSRQRVRRATRGGGEILLLPNFPRGCGGDYDNYAHFLYDLAFPLYSLIRTSDIDSDVVVFCSTRHEEKLRRLFPGNIEVISDEIPSGDLKFFLSLG
jgi:hypothetical protein